MKYAIILLFFSCYLKGQTDTSKIILSGLPDNVRNLDLLHSDTTIENQKFKIIRRFNLGQVRLVGQFGELCSGDEIVKQGHFISYNRNGKQIHNTFYCYGHNRNRRVLGLKHGWWGGCYGGREKKYFLGIGKFTVISVPCF